MTIGATQPALSDRFLSAWWRNGWRGLHLLRRMRQVAFGTSRILARTSYGSVFDLSPGSYIDDIVVREGYYESEVFEALRPYLGTGAVLWDIGANFGLHSVTAKLLYPASTVFAFEPNPPMGIAIKANAALNGVELEVLPYALSATCGRATFHVNDQGNSGMSTLCAWPGGHYDRQITVECARADDLVSASRLEVPTVVKLDVEGGEAAVLDGFGTLLRQPELRAVVLEAAAGLVVSGEADPVAETLRSAGFQLAPLERREQSHHPLENYLATRRY